MWKLDVTNIRIAVLLLHRLLQLVVARVVSLAALSMVPCPQKTEKSRTLPRSWQRNLHDSIGPFEAMNYEYELHLHGTTRQNSTGIFMKPAGITPSAEARAGEDGPKRVGTPLLRAKIR